MYKVKHRRLFSFATWFVNMTGSFLLAGLIHLYDVNQINEAVWVFFEAYTTFSIFGLETIQLIRTNQVKVAFIYVSTLILLSCIGL